MNMNITVKQYKSHISHINVPDTVESSVPEDLSILPQSLWQSPGGSLYKCIDGEFVCVSVHSYRFRGWINKVAIRNIHQIGNVCYADQAFRGMATGDLGSWERITLELSENKIIKHFPAQLVEKQLVYSLTEIYTRIYEH